MAEENTHKLVLVPDEDGTYKDEESNRFNIWKFDISANVKTDHTVIKGTTIKAFIQNSTYKKA